MFSRSIFEADEEVFVVERRLCLDRDFLSDDEDPDEVADVEVEVLEDDDDELDEDEELLEDVDEERFFFFCLLLLFF